MIAAVHAASWRLAYRGSLDDDYLDGDIASEREAMWASRLNRPAPGQRVIVADAEGDITGFACVYLDHHRRWGSMLDNLHVRGDCQRQGLGSKLLRAVGLELAASSVSGLYLWVLEANAHAVDFYRAHGARRVGADLWQAPCGTQVPRIRMAWEPDRRRGRAVLP